MTQGQDPPVSAKICDPEGNRQGKGSCRCKDENDYYALLLRLPADCAEIDIPKPVPGDPPGNRPAYPLKILCVIYLIFHLTIADPYMLLIFILQNGPGP